MRRVLVAPSWLARHLLLVCSLAAFALLGRWQWDVSVSRTGSLQNTIYAFQWWSFGLIFCYGWWRMLREELRGDRPEPAGETVVAAPANEPWVPPTLRRRQVLPPPDEASDAELAAYNRYLAALNERDRRVRSR